MKFIDYQVIRVLLFRLKMFFCCILLFTASLESSYAEEARAYSLPELLDFALCNNRDTQKSWASVRQAEGIHGQSLSDNYPSLSFSGHWTRSHTSTKPEFPSHSESCYSPSIHLSYLLFDFGERHHSHEATRYALLAIKHQHDWSIQNVILEVIKAYTNFLNAEEGLSAREADFSNAKSSLEIIEELHHAGLRTSTDVLQVKAALANSKIQLEESKGRVHTSLAKLKNAVGLPMNEGLHVTPIPETLSIPDISQTLENYLKNNQDEREDLKAARLYLSKKESELSKAKAAGHVQVSLDGSAGKNYNSGFSKENFHSAAAIKLSIPLFQGYYYKEGVKKAEAELEHARADLANKEADASLEVVSQYWALKTATQKHSYSKEYLEYSQAAYLQSQEQIKEGVGDIQALLDTQKVLTDARLQHLQSKTEWLTSLAELSYASGLLTKDIKIYEEQP